MLVIKLGGSLLGSAELPLWLDAIVKNSDGRVLIVPGGGMFADAVRVAQKAVGFDDATAHELAVMAMDQTARVLVSINPSLVTASTELEISERSWQHRAIVWMPSHMVLADEQIAKSWDVTSDSLAAWLAIRIKAQHLVLVKSVKMIPDVAGAYPADLVDAAFAEFSAKLPCPVTLLGKTEMARFPALLKRNVERSV